MMVVLIKVFVVVNIIWYFFVRCFIDYIFVVLVGVVYVSNIGKFGYN